jgi:zinc/manganese transport system permease protein
MLGFLGMAAVAAGVLEAVGVRRARERDLVTGIVLGAGLGVTALLLNFDVTTTTTTGAAVSVLFGSMFAVPPAVILPAVGIGVGAGVATGVIYRPLLLCSVAPELGAVAGVDPRLIGFLHLLILALAVTLSAMTVGAILSTALLIGPAAAALRMTRRTGSAIAVAAGIGLGSAWGGIVLAYVSYGWSPGHTWPVSSFIVSIIFVVYLVSGLFARAG